ncbi:endonuclease V [Pelodytes ibericus]
MASIELLETSSVIESISSVVDSETRLQKHEVPYNELHMPCHHSNQEQTLLKEKLISCNTEAWQEAPDFLGLKRIGGVDLSYNKEDGTVACASLVVLRYPDLEVIYEDCHMVTLDAPYVAGFLAFREVPSLAEAIKGLLEKDPSLMPQVLLVDGNGILHHRGFGLACHLGIVTGLPCIGVAKNLLQVDGLENNEEHKKQIRQMKSGGDFFNLTGSSGGILGAALKSCNKSSKPIYISVGHKISLESAVRLVHSCCKYRVPEPIRQSSTDKADTCVSAKRIKTPAPSSSPTSAFSVGPGRYSGMTSPTNELPSQFSWQTSDQGNFYAKSQLPLKPPKLEADIAFFLFIPWV